MVIIMNKIKIESKEELEKLYEKYNAIMFGKLDDNGDIRNRLVDVIDEIYGHLENYGFIFNEFKLIVGKYLYKVVVNKADFSITLRKRDDYGLIESVHDYNINYEDYISNKLYRLVNKSAKTDEMDTILNNVDGLMTAIEVIIYYSIHSEVVIKDSSAKTTSSVTSKKIQSTKTTNDATYSLTDIIVKYSKHITRTGHKNTITCEHWNVRGHYRHYKNGKVVWIPEYEKGKNREAKIQAKTYKI